MTELVASPQPFEALLTEEYHEVPTHPPLREYIWYERECSGVDIPGAVSRYVTTRGTPPIDLRYNAELCLAPDPVSDAFGRLAAFGLDGYRGSVATREQLARTLDLGTGSGIFSISMLNSLRRGHHNVELDIVDNDITALGIADINLRAAIQNLPSVPTINQRLASWLDGATGTYDCIYFNPPYLEPDHEIVSSDAARAPFNAIRVERAWQEYEKVVPHLGRYLKPGGFAIIRLPKEPDEEMFQELGRLCKDLPEPLSWSFTQVKAGSEQREGFGLLLFNGYSQAGLNFSLHDAYYNGLDPRATFRPEEDHSAVLYTCPTESEHPSFTVSAFKRTFMQQRLGRMTTSRY